MKTAFIFSGQGSQYAGMGRELYSGFDCVRDVFDKADEVLDFSVTDMCFGEDERLNDTEYTQPALLTLSFAIYRLLSEKGIKADYLAGLSLGEYSAHTASGTFDFADAVRLVRKRGKFMSEAVPKGEGAMCAVMNLDAESIQSACDEAKDTGTCMIANYNAPGQIVIAGDTKAVEKAAQLVLEKGAKRAVMLNVSGPFHTSLLKSASEKLAAELEKTNINEMKIPVISNLTADVVSETSAVKDILIKQVMNPVKWEQSVYKMLNLGVDTFIEAGPGRTLSSFVKKAVRQRGAENISIYNVEDMKTLEKTLGGLGI